MVLIRTTKITLVSQHYGNIFFQNFERIPIKRQKSHMKDLRIVGNGTQKLMNIGKVKKTVLLPMVNSFPFNVFTDSEIIMNFP